MNLQFNNFSDDLGINSPLVGNQKPIIMPVSTTNASELQSVQAIHVPFDKFYGP